jgi:hypothetical protein
VEVQVAAAEGIAGLERLHAEIVRELRLFLIKSLGGCGVEVQHESFGVRIATGGDGGNGGEVVVIAVGMADNDVTQGIGVKAEFVHGVKGHGAAVQEDMVIEAL